MKLTKTSDSLDWTGVMTTYGGTSTPGALLESQTMVSAKSGMRPASPAHLPLGHTEVRSDLLDAWLHDGYEEPVMFDAIWGELLYARAVLERVANVDFSHALADLYCASYRWHLACSSADLSSTTRHRIAASKAMDEVRNVQRLADEEADIFELRWCS